MRACVRVSDDDDDALCQRFNGQGSIKATPLSLYIPLLHYFFMSSPTSRDPWDPDIERVNTISMGLTPQLYGAATLLSLSLS